MTYSQFYTKLKNVACLFRWTYDDKHGIVGYRRITVKHPDDPSYTKRVTNCFCPLTAVAFIETHDYYSQYQWDEAGRLIGLSDQQTYSIMQSADNAFGYSVFASRKIRASLLRNINLL